MAGKFCAICQTTVVAGEKVCSCPSCSLPYHAECWQENGGCAQYGCPSAPATEKAAPAIDAGMTAWGGEKDCPACGRRIKGKAVKCRFCGATFNTREVMSSKAYSEREYADKEATKARNTVVGLFLLSATGCLSPVMAVIMGILIFHGSCCGVEFKRLPPALRALTVCAFGICCLLSFLALLIAVFDS